MRTDAISDQADQSGIGISSDANATVEDHGLAPGTVVGEYVIERQIGAGAFGSVYAAEHPVIGKRAAIKVLAKRYSSDKEVVSRFVAEARAVNRIRHDNIVDIFSFGKLQNEQQYLVMEYLEGLSFREFIEEHGRKLSLAQASGILIGIADALDAAHEHGIIHRDLKPDNIFLVRERSGQMKAKLLDFGVAKLQGEAGQAHKTATGVAVGTPLYMSPEQCRGRKVDHRADVYSFGAMVQEMLSGAPLFDGETAMDVLMKHVNSPAPRLSSVAPTLPPELDAPMLAMLAKKAEARPPSVGLALMRLLDAGRAAGLVLPAYSANVSARVADLAAETAAKSGENDATRKLAATPSFDGRGSRSPSGAPVDSEDEGSVPTRRTALLEESSPPGVNKAVSARSNPAASSSAATALAESSPSDSILANAARASSKAVDVAPAASVALNRANDAQSSLIDSRQSAQEMVSPSRPLPSLAQPRGRSPALLVAIAVLAGAVIAGGFWIFRTPSADSAASSMPGGPGALPASKPNATPAAKPLTTAQGQDPRVTPSIEVGEVAPPQASTALQTSDAQPTGSAASSGRPALQAIGTGSKGPASAPTTHPTSAPSIAPPLPTATTAKPGDGLFKYQE